MSETNLLPAAGELRGNAHIFPVRVFYEDTDAAGIVYYANYLRYAERARTELVRSLGWGHRDMMKGDSQLAFAVRFCAADYRKPAYLDDALTVQSTVTEIGGAAMTMVQNICRDGEVLVAIEIKLVCITMAGRPSRIPADVREKLAGLVE